MSKVNVASAVQQAARVKLDNKSANEIAGALNRFRALTNYNVLTKEHEAELRGTVEYLNQAWLTHAEELLGCYFIIHNEYEPLISTIAGVAQRVSGILANAAVLRAEHAQAQSQTGATAVEKE
jgi:hypothetical protein